jgi:bacterioferritin
LDKNQLIHKLNFFYSLELNQVELYTTQSKKVDDQYISKVLEKSAQIEEGHVYNIAAQIRELGAKPTILGEFLGPITGKIGGSITPLTGLINMLKANVMLEKKAMADYRNLISKVENDKGLVGLLWSNLIDEDLHTAWFSSKIEQLEKELEMYN